MTAADSGLHQLCVPLLDHLGDLPPPQRDALATVFGLSAGPAPDPFLVGLAALTLVAQAPAVWAVEIVSGTLHATPRLETSALVIALATSRVLARLAPGSR
jgi:hypothetical protein